MALPIYTVFPKKKKKKRSPGQVPFPRLSASLEFLHGSDRAPIRPQLGTQEKEKEKKEKKSRLTTSMENVIAIPRYGAVLLCCCGKAVDDGFWPGSRSCLVRDSGSQCMSFCSCSFSCHVVCRAVCGETWLEWQQIELSRRDDKGYLDRTCGRVSGFHMLIHAKPPLQQGPCRGNETADEWRAMPGTCAGLGYLRLWREPV